MTCPQAPQHTGWRWMASPRQRRAWLAAGVGATGLHAWAWTVLSSADIAATPPAAARQPLAAVTIAAAAPPAPAQALPVAQPAMPTPRRPAPPTPATAAPPTAPPSIASPALIEAPPVYPTQLAPPSLLSYELSRGPAQGQALLLWRPAPEGYEARLERWLDGRPLLSLSSRGGIDAAGLAPERQTDDRLGRARRATNFQREAGKISFSGSSLELPLPGGAQDRLSWMLQLGAIVAARPETYAPGHALLLPVAAGQGRLQTWRFVVQAPQTVDLPVGRVASAVYLQRLPEGPYEPQIDIWLDPQRHFLPVRLRWSREGSDQALEMTLNKEPTTP